MNQRLFQDAGGTTPAIIAGQPVGLIKRLAGSVDAVQATALSKPTLARHPRNGVRNLAKGAQAVGVNSFWSTSFVANGLTGTRVNFGIDTDGLPFADYRYTGIATSGSVSGAYVHLNSRRPSVGGVYGISLSTRLISGSLNGVIGYSAEIAAETAINGYVTNINRQAQFPSDGSEVSVSFSGELTHPDMQQIRCAPVFRADIGAEIDVTIRWKGLQFWEGPSAPFQFNYGPHDITEAGVGDLWHLYNDGGDSLNVTLPAGTYGLASIDINRAITVTTITSDGTTPINTLRHERQLDVMLRAGAFSSGEEIAIRDYWGRVFA